MEEQLVFINIFFIICIASFFMYRSLFFHINLKPSFGVEK